MIVFISESRTWLGIQFRYEYHEVSHEKTNDNAKWAHPKHVKLQNILLPLEYHEVSHDKTNKNAKWAHPKHVKLQNILPQLNTTN